MRVKGQLMLAFLLPLIVGGCIKRTTAIVNGEPIPSKEWRQALVRAYGARMLQIMIDRLLIRQEARRRGITVSQAEVNKAFEEWKRTNFPSPEALAHFLRVNLLTLEQVKRDIEFEIIFDKLLAQDFKVKPEEAKRFYEAHKERFRTPVMVTFEQIMLSSKERAKEVRERALKGKEKFSELARKFSEDQATKGRGGRRGPLAIGQVEPEFREVLLKLKPGEISQPIEVGGFYFLLRLVRREGGDILPFKEVEDFVTRMVRLNKAARELGVEHPVPAEMFVDVIRERYCAQRLRPKASVRILDQRFRWLEELYGVALRVPKMPKPVERPAIPERKKQKETKKKGE